MERYLANGGTLLLCSHSMYHIQKLCTHALWLKDGRVERYGAAADVTQAYLAYHEEKTARRAARTPSATVAAAGVAGHYAMRSLELSPSGPIAQDSQLAVRGEVYSPDGRVPVVLVGIVRADGTPVYGVGTDMDGVRPAQVAPDRYAFTLTLPGLALLPGKYYVRGFAADPEGMRIFDTCEVPLVVTGESREMGFVRLPHHWHDDAVPRE
jgi:lipopolysaccharide transport system ATP-binding protein